MRSTKAERRAVETRTYVVGAGTAFTLSLLVAIATGNTGHTASAIAGIALGLLIGGFTWLNHRDRRAAALALGHFGASCNLYLDDLKSVPRFAPLLADAKLSIWARVPSSMPDSQRSIMGGAILMDRAAITWTPSIYRSRKGIPPLTVPWGDVEEVTCRPLFWLGNQGVLEVRLRSGGEWLLYLSDRDAAMAYITGLDRDIQVNAEP